MKFASRIMVMGLLSFLLGCTKAPSSGGASQDQLSQALDQLSKSHKMEFRVHFTSQIVAEQAAPKIKAEGFDVAVMADTNKGGWVCIASKTMTPDLGALERAQRALEAIAVSSGGKYEGGSGHALKEEK